MHGVLAMGSGWSGGVRWFWSSCGSLVAVGAASCTNTVFYGDIMRKAVQEPGKVLQPFGEDLKEGVLVSCHLQLREPSWETDSYQQTVCKL